jgi:hypothetical protein
VFIMFNRINSWGNSERRGGIGYTFQGEETVSAR